MSTPFLDFWRALNAQCKRNGYPELTFGPASRVWRSTIETAQREAFGAAWREAG